jgi:putative glutamine amidotransferase
VTRPLIGITSPATGPAIGLPRAYADAVTRAGGAPIVVPPPDAAKASPEPAEASADEQSIARSLVARLDGLLFTGGDDPIMEPFGGATDRRVTPVHPARQRFECLLLDTAERERPGLPILCVCLGMQFMCLRAGGTLDQWLAESLGDAGARAHHPGPPPTAGTDDRRDTTHALRVLPAAHGLLGGAGTATVISWHRQGIRDAGSLSVLARAEDGLIEAVRDDARPWCVGVQWHPERAGPGPLGDGLIGLFVDAARSATPATTS